MVDLSQNELSYRVSACVNHDMFDVLVKLLLFIRVEGQQCETVCKCMSRCLLTSDVRRARREYTLLHITSCPASKNMNIFPGAA